MKAVIVLTTLVHLSQVVEYINGEPQLSLADVPLPRFPQCFPIPLPLHPPTPPPPSPPLPPCCPLVPPPPLPPVSSPEHLCSKLPTGPLSALLDIIGNLLNLPKGSLSKVPLCCKRSVPLGPSGEDLMQSSSNAPWPNPGPFPVLSSLTPEKLQLLIAQLSTPQALDPEIKIPFLQSVLCRCNSASCPKPSPPIIIPPLPCPQGFPQCCVRTVVDDCAKNVPVYQNIIRSEEEHFVKHIPVFEKTITNQEESIIRQVPIIQKFMRPVVETKTRHIPVIRKRIRTVVEPYTTHVPVLMKYCRPVEETVIRNVPVMERKCRPVFMNTVRQVPITETKIRPVVESCITQVPVKQRILKNFIEQRVKQIIDPCHECPCCNPCNHCPFPKNLPHINPCDNCPFPPNSPPILPCDNCPFPPNSPPILPCDNCLFPPNSPHINPFPSPRVMPNQRLSILRPSFSPCSCSLNFPCIR